MMGISRVRGAFSEFSGTLALGRNDLTRSSATLVIRTRSLTTFNGAIRDQGRDERVGLEGRSISNRKDYGIVGQARYN